MCETQSSVLPEEQPHQHDERYSTRGFLTHAAPTFLVFIIEGRQKLKGKQKSRSASGYYKLRIDRQSQLPVAKQPRELVDHTLGL